MNFLSQALMADPTTPMVIWMVLMLAALPALALLSSPEAIRDPGAALMASLGALRRYRAERDRARRQAVEATRFADEMQVAAVQADDAAQRWQDLWRQAAEHADGAWQDWQDAEQQVTRARAAAAFGPPWAARTPTEYVDRERFLHRAVRAAVQRGDLPSTALADALAARGGWDPRLHPVEQELVLLRAVADHRQRRYRRVATTERTARHDVRLAVAARDSLRHETSVAASAAAPLRRYLPPAPRPARDLQPA
ncbi:hypothetical protein [Actinoplanes awajinensis]|uniref:Uncharacterized protein n=1 Tax=Actinoplanes awajinensis subsp. mycoplanecinus TaxID=135947 RepID=A0A101JJN5_9ACTN|nr:hypothetical protein [Actinoplanes awajinensis]KUL28009.1 hypothetical protein ADL15_32905 [Actinoplanes awajinensis subsp. mycoplanecinus]